MASSNNNKRQLKTPITKKKKPTSDVDVNIDINEKTQSSISIENINTGDDYVSSQWRAQPAVTEFLLRNAYCAMQSSRANIIFNPFPTSWIGAVFDYQTMIRDRSIVSNIDISLN